LSTNRQKMARWQSLTDEGKSPGCPFSVWCLVVFMSSCLHISMSPCLNVSMSMYPRFQNANFLQIKNGNGKLLSVCLLQTETVNGRLHSWVGKR
jgi:hypothetical protein